jgi:hypothetical protein
MTRPSVGETAGEISVIWAGGEGECFCKQDWTRQIRLNRLKNSADRRGRYGIACPCRLPKRLDGVTGDEDIFAMRYSLA